jgi:small subunit ribosomal protein S20
MANLKSSKKDVRRSRRKALFNKSVKTSLKTYIKKVRVAAASSEPDVNSVAEALRLAIKSLDKAAQSGIIHKNQAARRKSRIAKQANAALKS